MVMSYHRFSGIAYSDFRFVVPCAIIFLVMFGCIGQVKASGEISLLLPNDLQVSPLSNGIMQSDIAFDGTNYFIVWTDALSGINGQFVSKSGTFIGSSIIIVPQGSHSVSPSVAFNGQKYLVVYSGMKDGGGSNSKLSGVFISPQGIVSTSFDIALVQNDYPAIASDGNNFLVVWNDARNYSTNYWDVFGQFVSPTGGLLGNNFQISPSAKNQIHPYVTFGGDNYFVVWMEETTPGSGDRDISGTRVSRTSSILDPNSIPVSTAPGVQGDSMTPTVSYGSNNYFVVWDDYRSSRYEVYGARVSLDGVLLDGPPDSGGINISNDNIACSPRGGKAVFDGTQWFVAWGGCQIKGARVSSSGTVLDNPGTALSKINNNEWDPNLAFDGSNFLQLGVIKNLVTMIPYMVR
jgi:hypothetical protein